MIKKIIFDAYEYATEKHKGQMRKNSNLEYITHPKYVARIVEQLTDNPNMVAAAFLHDVLEDTDATFIDLRDRFGIEVADLVNELTNKKEERGTMKKKDYILQKMSLMSPDALTIKLSDRLHNVLFLERDCTDVEEFSFIKYYYKNTRFIIDNLIERREEEGNELTKVHQVLIDRINAVLNFLQIRYSL